MKPPGPLALFVTGTDTGVGKTHVASSLCREGRARGWRVFGHKPIETGCPTVDGQRVAADARALADASGGWQVGEALCQYMLELPLAPAVAARHERICIERPRIVETIQRLSKDRDLTIIEGAGGWRVPLADAANISDLARDLGYPVLIVARAGLGTINHTLLTIEAVRHDGCEIWGVAMSVRPSDDADLALSNRDEIAARAGCRVWIPRPALVLDRL